eukprot:scaffold53608_cov30-Tisochrysis_lutea.AAC.3
MMPKPLEEEMRTEPARVERISSTAVPTDDVDGSSTHDGPPLACAAKDGGGSGGGTDGGLLSSGLLGERGGDMLSNVAHGDHGTDVGALNDGEVPEGPSLHRLDALVESEGGRRCNQI